MIKDKYGQEVVYWIGGSAGICPACGNGNAMLDTVRTYPGNCHSDGTLVRFEDLECRDCGHICYEGAYVNVAISYDANRRVYQGQTKYNMTADLAPFDDETNRPNIRMLMDYLEDHPTPETW